MPDASPAKWHLAHGSWFFETFVLRDHVPGYRPFDPRFAYLYNSYYEAEGARQPRAERGLLTRPTLDEVLAWRAHVDAALADALPILSPPARVMLTLGLAHEEQHQELLVTDILDLFARSPLAPAYGTAEPPAPAAPPMAWTAHPGGIVQVGAMTSSGFAFDCEGPAHDVLLRPFRLADRLVTNGEWMKFMDAGGYRDPLLWLSDGWTWVEREGIAAPLRWRRAASDKWEAFGLGGWRALDLDAPVTHVSHFEADAFATWAGARLPTEFEWEAATASASAPADMFGQRWQWTASAFLPYPGFRPTPGAAGEYNGKFMSGQAVLRGSSMATTPGHSRPSYRNFFPPRTRWQFSGVRLARDD